LSANSSRKVKLQNFPLASASKMSRSGEWRMVVLIDMDWDILLQGHPEPILGHSWWFIYRLHRVFVTSAALEEDICSLISDSSWTIVRPKTLSRFCVIICKSDTVLQKPRRWLTYLCPAPYFALDSHKY
jgi:hypothetical protein